MKQWLWTGLLLAGGVLSAGEVRIADAVGDTAVRQAAISRVLAGKGVPVGQLRMSAGAALASLKDGKADLVLIRQCDLPETRRKEGKVYAIEAAMISVHRDNPRNDCTSEELAEIFSGWKKSWVTLNGEPFQIHRLRQHSDSAPVQLFVRKILKKRTLAPAFERRDPMEILKLVRINKHAAALTARPDMEIPTDLKVLKVDGIYPALDQLRSGRYPLCERRVILYNAGKLSPEAKQFLQFLLSEEMAPVLVNDGLLQP